MAQAVTASARPYLLITTDLDELSTELSGPAEHPQATPLPRRAPGTSWTLPQIPQQSLSDLARSQRRRPPAKRAAMTDAATGLTRPACRWIAVIDGRQLRQLRGQQGLTQAALARQAAVSLSVVSRLERQPRASCRSRTLARLAAALGRPPADLTAPGVRLAAP